MDCHSYPTAGERKCPSRRSPAATSSWGHRWRRRRWEPGELLKHTPTAILVRCQVGYHEVVIHVFLYHYHPMFSYAIHQYPWSEFWPNTSNHTTWNPLLIFIRRSSSSARCGQASWCHEATWPHAASGQDTPSVGKTTRKIVWLVKGSSKPEREWEVSIGHRPWPSAAHRLKPSCNHEPTWFTTILGYPHDKPMVAISENVSIGPLRVAITVSIDIINHEVLHSHQSINY